jgi:hypothetical protein
MGHSTPTESGVYLHVLPGRQQKAVDCLEEDEEQNSNEDDQEDKTKVLSDTVVSLPRRVVVYGIVFLVSVRIRVEVGRTFIG